MPEYTHTRPCLATDNTLDNCTRAASYSIFTHYLASMRAAPVGGLTRVTAPLSHLDVRLDVRQLGITHKMGGCDAQKQTAGMAVNSRYVHATAAAMWRRHALMSAWMSGSFASIRMWAAVMHKKTPHDLPSFCCAMPDAGVS